MKIPQPFLRLIVYAILLLVCFFAVHLGPFDSIIAGSVAFYCVCMTGLV